MAEFGISPGEPRPTKQKEKNAYQKVAGLRARRAPLFWAVGPENYNYPYRVLYEGDGHIMFKSVSEEELCFDRLSTT